ncbi:hypothetical protein GCM10022409_27680 [Hymenobacter glaciei]|uniref:Uncharacterized protein n=1 Tax=Hymenobacter glaciei TaxID=877209 RepID=A0ABP7UCJ8_9BACT
MFIGHFGLGFGAKAAQPRVSLGTLFLAAQFADILWPNLLLLGVEQVRMVPGLMVVSSFDFVYYPFSHSLAMDVVWGLLLGLSYWLLRRNAGGALLVGLLVPSHWLLDLVVHRPDLPLFLGSSPLLGLGLWNSMAGTQAVEALFFFVGLYGYLRTTRARNRQGCYGVWGLAAFILLVHISSLLSQEPMTTAVIGWGGQLLWLPVLLAYWVDRNREVRAGTPATAETHPASAPSTF